MDKQIIVQGRHPLDETFATLHFPAGVLPKGKLKLNLIGLDYCTTQAHDHFKNIVKMPYPSTAEYSTQIEVPPTRMSVLNYKVRKSIMTLDLQSHVQSPPPSVESTASMTASSRQAVHRLHRQEEPMEVDPQPAQEGEAFNPQLPDLLLEGDRYRRQAESDRRISIIARFQKVVFQQSRYSNLQITNNLTIAEYLAFLNAILAQCHKQAGYILNETPEFTLEDPTSSEISMMSKFFLSTDEYKTVVLKVPFNAGIALPEGPPWICLGFTKGLTGVTGEPGTKLIKNTFEDKPVLKVRATYPVHPNETVHVALARIGKEIKQSSLWLGKPVAYQPYIGIFHHTLAFGIDLTDFEFKPEFQRDEEYTLVFLRFIISTIAECFQLNSQNFFDVMLADEGKMSFTPFPKLPEDGSAGNLFTLRLTFANAQFAQQWGFVQRSVEYSALAETDIPIETTFKPESSYLDLSDDVKLSEKNRLYRALHNVYMNTSWGSTPETRLPLFLKMFLKERDRILQGGPDLPVFEQRPVAEGGQEQPPPVGPPPEEQPPPEQPPPPASPPPEPQPPLDPILIPNPEPRPSDYFIPWSRPIVGPCETPQGFPDKYHVLLHEGDKNDYITDLGHTCIWASKGFGTTRTLGSSGSGIIINNYDWDRTLHIQFLTSDLGLYKRKKQGEVGEGRQPEVDAYIRAAVTAKVLIPFK